jgi:kinesin family protein 1
MPPKIETDAENIKVAVRVRPFNQRELESNAKLVVEMSGTSTSLIDPSGKGAPKTFTFDYSYWSFDGFGTDPTGLCVPTSPQYADQRRVFDDLGVGVVRNAFLGYNSALFAYGQTGSGKSYSMIGYGTNKGIVPLTCEAMFQQIEQNSDITRQFQVTFSMLEIYNEKVRDLLVPIQQSPGGLKVRQSPKAGFFVEGLKHVAVSSFADIEHWMAQGTVMRTTASTKMNETSSRSHMVITINFKQVPPFRPFRPVRPPYLLLPSPVVPLSVFHPSPVSPMLPTRPTPHAIGSHVLHHSF